LNQASLSRLLSSLGVLLIIFFGIALGFDIFPPKLLQPEWILIYTSSLANFVTIPLFGIIFILLAGYIYQESLGKTQFWAARFAALLAVLYILVQPMLGFAVWKSLADLSVSNKQQISAINKQASDLAKAINKATSFDGLRASMRRLNGPPIPEIARSVDLADLKKRTLESVVTARDSFPGRLNTPTSPAFVELYKRAIRTSILSIVATIAFGFLSWNPISDRNVLIAFLKSIGLFGITPISIYTATTTLVAKAVSKFREDSEINTKRRAAAIRQRQLSKMEAEQLREHKRQQINEQKRVREIQKERARMEELERRMERRRELEREKERRGK
jgi:hypothetical protein